VPFQAALFRVKEIVAGLLKRSSRDDSRTVMRPLV
jgi:hypothetical protein